MMSFSVTMSGGMNRTVLRSALMSSRPFSLHRGIISLGSFSISTPTSRPPAPHFLHARMRRCHRRQTFLENAAVLDNVGKKHGLRNYVECHAAEGAGERVAAERGSVAAREKSPRQYGPCRPRRQAEARRRAALQPPGCRARCRTVRSTRAFRCGPCRTGSRRTPAPCPFGLHTRAKTAKILRVAGFTPPSPCTGSTMIAANRACQAFPRPRRCR